MSQSLALERLRALGASAMWVVYHDYAGLGRAKAVPKGRFGDVAASGVSFAMANWDLIVNDHQVPHPAFGADSGDFRALPDPAFIVPVPHRPGVAQAAATLVTDTGEPWPGDPRALLAAQVRRLAARGIRVQAAFEAEFAIVAADRGPDGLLTDPARMFTVDELDHRWALGERLLAALEVAEIPVHQWAKEYGPGQFELSLLPADPVAAADRYLFARQLLRALAREVGLEVAPCGTYLTHLEQDFVFHAHTFTEEAFVTDDPDEVADRIEESTPDLLIGTHLEEEVAGALNVPFLPLCPPVATHPFAQSPLMGYAGSTTLADALDGVLRRREEKPEPLPPGLPWTDAALEELEEIPAFLRGRARRLAEERARELQAPEVTPEILADARA